MMKRFSSLFTFLLTLTLSLISITPIFAQEPGLGSGLGLPKHFTARKARCPACAFLANRYNSAREEVLDQEEYLDDVESDLARTEHQLTSIEADIANLKKQFIQHPSDALGKRIQEAEREQQRLSREYGRYERELSSEERNYNHMLDNLDRLEADLNNCEAQFCGAGAMAYPINQALYLHYITAIQLGLIFGNFSNSRSGYIQSPYERFSGSNAINNFMFGPQLRLMFGSPEVMHMFVLMNVITMFNATNTILRLRTDSFSSYDSRLRIITPWIAHLLIGLQSRTFANNFSVSGGVGGAVVNQEVKGDIAENVTTQSSSTKTSLIPSALVSLDYKLCQSCFLKHDLTLSGQVSADYYPSVSTSLTTPLGNAYKAKADSSWNFAEALVLSMQF